jgi:predicted amidohydrolase YtcJ
MDRLITNATVLTMDGSRPEAAAFGIEGDNISAVGSAEELLAQATPQTEVVDLGGRTVVPGFIDAHSHFGPITLAPYEIELRDGGVRSVQDILDRVARAARETPAGAWIRALGWNDLLLEDKRGPTRWELDEVAPDHLVSVVHFGYHRTVANTRALALAGLVEGAQEFPCGVVHRDEQGRPNGMLSEEATNPVIGRSLDMELERLAAEMPDLVERNCRLHLAAGVTAVQDAWVSPHFLEVFTQAAEAGKLPIYFSPLRGHTEGLFGTPAPWLEPGRIDQERRPKHIRRGGIKLFASGVWEGILYYSQEELNRLASAAHNRGLTVAMHVSSDAGTQMALAAAEHAKANETSGAGRIRLEHLFWATEADVQRLKASGAGLVTQMDALYRNRARPINPNDPHPPMRFPIGALRAAGVEVGGSSDAPCFGMPPLRGVGAAVHRHTANGDPIDTGQAVTVEEALRIHTLGAAWAGGTDDVEGSIAPGKLANFAVLAQDPRRAPSGTIRDITVDETWVDGRRAYQRDINNGGTHAQR